MVAFAAGFVVGVVGGPAFLKYVWPIVRARIATYVAKAR